MNGDSIFPSCFTKTPTNLTFNNHPPSLTINYTHLRVSWFTPTVYSWSGLYGTILGIPYLFWFVGISPNYFPTVCILNNEHSDLTWDEFWWIFEVIAIKRKDCSHSTDPVSQKFISFQNFRCILNVMWQCSFVRFPRSFAQCIVRLDVIEYFNLFHQEQIWKRDNPSNPVIKMNNKSTRYSYLVFIYYK